MAAPVALTIALTSTLTIHPLPVLAACHCILLKARGKTALSD